LFFVVVVVVVVVVFVVAVVVAAPRPWVLLQQRSPQRLEPVDSKMGKPINLWEYVERAKIYLVRIVFGGLFF
jgi:hypothetical protein